MADQLINKKLSLVLLQKAEVTSEHVLAHIQYASLIHYYGHGYLDWNNLEASYIKMYSPDTTQLLPMDQISQSLQQHPSALVILSACETAMIDVANYYWQDQYIGLPAGFLRAGANTVVGSLWTIQNQATCLLFGRFYQNIFASKKKIGPAEVLLRA